MYHIIEIKNILRNPTYGWKEKYSTSIRFLPTFPYPTCTLNACEKTL